jgi:hypothetical protein
MRTSGLRASRVQAASARDAHASQSVSATAPSRRRECAELQNRAEQDATLNQQGHFEIGLDLAISEAGRVTSVVVVGDASTEVRKCLETRALRMDFHLVVPCPGGTHIRQPLAMGNAGGKAQ